MSVEFHEPTKAAVTVAEMARMVGLSRARFYQLLGTAFPFPVYDVSTRRPAYVEEQQRVCLEVRRRNCGIDGKPVLFYARRFDHVAGEANATKSQAEDQTDRTARRHRCRSEIARHGVGVECEKCVRRSRSCFPPGSKRRLRARSSEPFFSISSVRIRLITSGDKSPYQPSKQEKCPNGVQFAPRR